MTDVPLTEPLADVPLAKVIVQLRENGPILIKGPITLVDHQGNVFDLTSEKANVALCRCSHSSRRPFCDGSHKAHGFCAAELAQQS
jgi:CDGSH-type Zn-finger protein